MEYKDFIKPGEKVIHVPEEMGYDLWMYAPEVVTIGKYRPYYTDGTPDPKPEDYDANCFVEIEGETSWGETQLSLNSLYPIIKGKEEKEVVYNSKVCKLVGYDEEKNYVVIEVGEEWKVVFPEDVTELKGIYDLTFDELKSLREQICLGSIYISDYNNNLGVPADEVCAESESYIDGLCEQFGMEWQDYDTPTTFAEYFTA